jgi:hypothetical protein
MGFSQNAKKYRNIYLSVVGVVSLGIITSGITLSALPPRNLALRSSFYEAKISGDETIYMNLGDSASYQYTARAFNRDITRDSKTV